MPAPVSSSGDGVSESPSGNGFLISGIGSLFLPAVAFVTAPVLAQALGVDGRGEVAAATAPYLLMAVVAGLGLPDAVTHFVAKRTGRLGRGLRRAMLMSFGLGVVAALVVSALSGWLSGGDGRLAHYIQIGVSPLPVYLCVGILRGYAAGLHRWRLIATEQGIFAISRLVLIVSLMLTGHLQVLAAVLIFVISPILGGLAYFPLLRRPRSGDQQADLRSERFRPILAYGTRVWMGAISGVLLYRLDQTLMTPLSSTEQLGLYVVAAAVGELPGIVTTSVQNVTLAQESKEPSLVNLARTARVATLVCLLGGLGLAAVSPWLIPLLFGREFVGSVVPAAVLLASAVVAATGGVVGAGLAARGRPGLRSLVLTASCVANLILLLILVPGMGALGAALAMLGGSAVSTFVSVFMLVRVFEARPVAFLGMRRSDMNLLWSTARGLIRR